MESLDDENLTLDDENMTQTGSMQATDRPQPGPMQGPAWSHAGPMQAPCRSKRDGVGVSSFLTNFVLVQPGRQGGVGEV